MNEYEVTFTNGKTVEIEAWTPEAARVIAIEDAELECRWRRNWGPLSRRKGSHKIERKKYGFQKRDWYSRAQRALARIIAPGDQRRESGSLSNRDRQLEGRTNLVVAGVELRTARQIEL